MQVKANGIIQRSGIDYELGAEDSTQIKFVEPTYGIINIVIGMNGSKWGIVEYTQAGDEGLYELKITQENRWHTSL